MTSLEQGRRLAGLAVGYLILAAIFVGVVTIAAVIIGGSYYLSHLRFCY